MSPARKISVTALAGGIGASKLLLGLYHAMDPHALTIIVNTGDDIVFHGLKISPDLDIVTYTLAGVVNPTTGWGMRGETFHFLKRLGAYGAKHGSILATVILQRTSIAPICSHTEKR